LQGVRARISGKALHEIMVGDMGDLKLRVRLAAEAEGPDLLVVRCLQQRFGTFVVLFDLTAGDGDLQWSALRSGGD
jgi:hypothetical protein